MFDSLTLLFARTATALECRCGCSGYCPCHGEYQPAVTDPEVVDAVNEMRHSFGGIRVIKKLLED